MVKETLLESHIEAGKALLQELDKRGFKITTAMWFFYPDLREWFLLLFSPEFVQTGKKTPEISQTVLYTKISEVLTSLGEEASAISLDSVKLVFKNNSLIKMFGSIIEVPGISKVRMTSNYFNGIYVEDALIYRNVSKI